GDGRSGVGARGREAWSALPRRAWERGGQSRGSLARYFSGFFRRAGSHPSQQTNTVRPLTTTLTGPPMESSGWLVTGHTFCRLASALSAGGRSPPPPARALARGGRLARGQPG